MFAHRVPDTAIPLVVAVWRHSFTSSFESVKRRSGNTAPETRSRKADWDLERFVLRERSRRPLPPRLRDAERPRSSSPRRSREGARPRNPAMLTSAVKSDQGVAATEPDPDAEPALAIAANFEVSAEAGRNGAQSAGANSAQATAVVRVASVGAGGLRVSWLARSVIDAFFLSPPDFDCPGV